MRSRFEHAVVRIERRLRGACRRCRSVELARWGTAAAAIGQDFVEPKNDKMGLDEIVR